MIITYFRSSSYNAHNMCPQQYFIEYNLGWRGLSGQKADKGTIVHKVLEILAFIKMYQQDNREIYEDDIAGSINVNNYDLSSIKSIVYNYYVDNTPHHKWSPKDERDCSNWVIRPLLLMGVCLILEIEKYCIQNNILILRLKNLGLSSIMILKMKEIYLAIYL